MLSRNSQKCRHGRETENIRFITASEKKCKVIQNPGDLTKLCTKINNYTKKELGYTKNTALLKLFMELKDKMCCVNL